MDDRALTEELARVAGLAVSAAELDALFGFKPELTEWSLNAAGDRRGALRTSVWTKDRGAAAAVVERCAPRLGAMREALVGEDFEGVGLALRSEGGSTFRWWTLADEGATLADRARRTWPEHAAMIDAVLAAAGGPHTCAALGVEAGRAQSEQAADRGDRRAREQAPASERAATGGEQAADRVDRRAREGASAADRAVTGGDRSAHERGPLERRTVYAELRTPEAALRVLELARVAVSQPANLFWKGIVGLEPGGRPWPRVWAGRSVGQGGGWKFYYFARGDELRRTDAVLLDAAGAGDGARAVWARLCEATKKPCVQLIGLTVPEGGVPSFTTYLARM